MKQVRYSRDIKSSWWQTTHNILQDIEIILVKLLGCLEGVLDIGVGQIRRLNHQEMSVLPQSVGGRSVVLPTNISSDICRDRG